MDGWGLLTSERRYRHSLSKYMSTIHAFRGARPPPPPPNPTTTTATTHTHISKFMCRCSLTVLGLTSSSSFVLCKQAATSIKCLRRDAICHLSLSLFFLVVCFSTNLASFLGISAACQAPRCRYLGTSGSTDTEVHAKATLQP
jgi:hypothetical protein